MPVVETDGLCRRATIGFGVFVIFTFACGIHALAALWLPILLLLTVMTALAVGLWTSALNALYYDVRYVIPFVVQFWMLASPVVYPSAGAAEVAVALWTESHDGSNRWISLGFDGARASAKHSTVEVGNGIARVAIRIIFLSTDGRSHLRLGVNGCAALTPKPKPSRPICGPVIFVYHCTPGYRLGMRKPR